MNMAIMEFIRSNLSKLMILLGKIVIFYMNMVVVLLVIPELS